MELSILVKVLRSFLFKLVPSRRIGECLFEVLNYSVVLGLQIKRLCSVFMGHVNFFSIVKWRLRHWALLALILNANTANAWIKLEIPTDLNLSYVEVCTWEARPLIKGPFKGFYIKCEDYWKYVELMERGDVEGARSLVFSKMKRKH
jgi:hypothetical protein